METFILRNEQVKQNAIDTINALEGLYEVVIRKHKKNLTGQQRNYWHACLEIIANHTGEDMEDLKMKIKCRVLPLREVLYEGKPVLYPPSSERITREQYSELIEATLMIAQSLYLSMPAANYYTGE